MSNPRGIPSLTPEQVDEIRERWLNGGVTHRELALEYDRSMSTIARAASGEYTFGRLHKRKLQDDEILKIHERYMAGGVKLKDLAKQYSVSSETLSINFDRLGLYRKKKPAALCKAVLG